MAIIIENLTKYFGGKKIFDDFSFSFPTKGVCALIGKSGVGKTTLLRMIAGLDKDFGGKITRDSSDSVSFAFQEHRLFPTLTALENVLFANFDTKGEAEKNICKNALSSLGFDDEDMHLYPRELSGGMKQRVSLARAFVNSSEILLLDEPTKELDPLNKAKVIEEIKRQANARLIIMVTHDPKDAEACNAVIIDVNR